MGSTGGDKSNVGGIVNHMPRLVSSRTEIIGETKLLMWFVETRTTVRINYETTHYHKNRRKRNR